MYLSNTYIRFQYTVCMYQIRLLPSPIVLVISDLPIRGLRRLQFYREPLHEHQLPDSQDLLARLGWQHILLPRWCHHMASFRRWWRTTTDWEQAKRLILGNPEVHQQQIQLLDHHSTDGYARSSKGPTRVWQRRVTQRRGRLGIVTITLVEHDGL